MPGPRRKFRSMFRLFSFRGRQCEGRAAKPHGNFLATIGMDERVEERTMVTISRRAWLQGAAVLALTRSTWADEVPGAPTNAQELPRARPPVGARHFTSEAVETTIQQVQKRIPDGQLSTIFENCFPNTLDTTVFPGTNDGNP